MKNLQSKHLIFIFIVIVITVGMYLFVPVATQKDIKKTNSEMPEAATAQVPQITIEEFKTKIEERFPSTLLSKINFLEKEANKTGLSEIEKSDLYSKLAAAYSDGGAPEVAAWYVSKKAAIANTSIAWERAGDNFVALQQDPQTADIIKPTINTHIIDCYQKALELAPSNADLKVKLGEGYMEGSDDVMQGVKLMLDVVRADSNHYMANLMLGKYGIKSGQYEKAIVRLEKVISLHSKKLDGYFLLVDAYAASGKNNEAAETLIKAKKLVTDKNLLKEIDVAINELKNKK